jgi:hypothetical protein
MTTPESSAILKELAELNARFAGLAFEMAGVRTTLEVQFKRIAELQAELDLLPAARRRREEMRTPTLPPTPGHNGNGRSHR